MKGKILKLLQKYGVLNVYQVCRLLNNRPRDNFAWCHHSFNEKPLGVTGISCRNVTDKQCKIHMTSVYGFLTRMKAPVQNRKMRFFDKGGIGSDVFRFFFLDLKEFESKVLSQTLIPYIQEEKLLEEREGAAKK